MARTYDEVRAEVMGLRDEDRQRLAEEIMTARWNPAWREAWLAESQRRLARIRDGEDRELSLDEFWDDADAE